MFDPNEYALLDFGAGRKLERFGAHVLDRPSPAATGAAVANPELWGRASARYESAKGNKGRWIHVEQTAPSVDPWIVRHRNTQLSLQCSPSGNVGIFPEQARNWDWIAEQVQHCVASSPERAPRVLNLFAYTGGASLAAASAGAEVTHVDSSGPTVAWAKRNATYSNMSNLPIRWIVEDALKFIERECRRGNFYDGIIADPPTYGHGPKGRPFKFEQHVGSLLKRCAELLDTSASNARFLLFSCHAPRYGPQDAKSAVSKVLGADNRVQITGRPLVLETSAGQRLAAGVSARWSLDC